MWQRTWCVETLCGIKSSTSKAQETRTKNQGPITKRPLKWNKIEFWKCAPLIFCLYDCIAFLGRTALKNSISRVKDIFPRNPKVQKEGYQDFQFYETRGDLIEIVPYGSKWTHIKTGKSCMAQDHFWTPPYPQENNHKQQTSLKRFEGWIIGWHTLQWEPLLPTWSSAMLEWDAMKISLIGPPFWSSDISEYLPFCDIVILKGITSQIG